MSAQVIPPCHVLRIKRDAGKIELEMMRFLTLTEMKARRPRRFQRADAVTDAAEGSAKLRDAILGMAR